MGVVCNKNGYSDSSLRNSIKRRFLVVNSESTPSPAPKTKAAHADYNVLVINSSAAMAKEITLAITTKMPLCSIMYAPGVDVAVWLLRKRKIDVVVSSPMLPDGGVEKLVPVCEVLSPSPDLVIVGEPEPEQIRILSSFGRVHDAHGYFSSNNSSAQSSFNEDPFKKLGADLRNDLNNPLQEIVAMVYVAKAGDRISPVTVQALEAIDKATKGLAETVQGLEERLRKNIPVKS